MNLLKQIFEKVKNINNSNSYLIGVRCYTTMWKAWNWMFTWTHKSGEHEEW